MDATVITEKDEAEIKDSIRNAVEERVGSGLNNPFNATFFAGAVTGFAMTPELRSQAEELADKSAKELVASMTRREKVFILLVLKVMNGNVCVSEAGELAATS